MSAAVEMAAESECTDSPVASQRLPRLASPTWRESDSASRVMQLCPPRRAQCCSVTDSQDRSAQYSQPHIRCTCPQPSAASSMQPTCFHYYTRAYTDAHCGIDYTATVSCEMQLLSKMDPGKEIAWVTENEDELTKSMETVHRFRKSTAFIAWARRARYQMPATATNLSPIEELRHLAVGALVRGATVHTSPSSASITTNVEVMTMLKELMAKVDKCNALQTRVNDLENSQQFLSSEFEALKESSKPSRLRPCSGSWQYRRSHLPRRLQSKMPLSSRAGERARRGRVHRAGIRDHPRHHGAAKRDSGVNRQTGQAASGRGPPKEAAGQAGVPEASYGSPDIRQTPQPAQQREEGQQREPHRHRSQSQPIRAAAPQLSLGSIQSRESSKKGVPLEAWLPPVRRRL